MKSGSVVQTRVEDDGKVLRARVGAILNDPDRAVIRVIDPGPGDPIIIIRDIARLTEVKESRGDRAADIKMDNGVRYLGDNRFRVQSQSRDTEYAVDLECAGLGRSECDCPDNYGGNLCKHIIAAELWLKGNNVYKYARAIVENNPQWSAGQSRRAWSSDSVRVIVAEARELLFLEAWYQRRMVRVQIGHLNPLKGWYFSLEEKTYRAWQARVQDMVENGKDGMRETVRI